MDLNEQAQHLYPDPTHLQPEGLHDFNFDAQLELPDLMLPPPNLQQQQQQQHHQLPNNYQLPPLFRSGVPVDWHTQPLSPHTPFDQTHQTNYFDAAQQFSFLDPQLAAHNAASSHPASHHNSRQNSQSDLHLQYSNPASPKHHLTPQSLHQLNQIQAQQAPHLQHVQNLSLNQNHLKKEDAPLPNGGGSNGSSGGDEDKRQRNSAASARFRAKRKMREEALQIETRRKMDGLGLLEEKARELERENKFLRGLLVGRDEWSDEDENRRRKRKERRAEKERADLEAVGDDVGEG